MIENQKLHTHFLTKLFQRAKLILNYRRVLDQMASFAFLTLSSRVQLGGDVYIVLCERMYGWTWLLGLLPRFLVACRGPLTCLFV